MISKYQPIRSPKLTQSAKGQRCTLRIPGVCRFDDSTTVLCHAPSHVKGAAQKSSDEWSAYGCSHCHDWVDGKASYKPSKEEVKLAFFDAISETQTKFRQQKLLGVIK